MWTKWNKFNQRKNFPEGRMLKFEKKFKESQIWIFIPSLWMVINPKNFRNFEISVKNEVVVFLQCVTPPPPPPPPSIDTRHLLILLFSSIIFMGALFIYRKSKLVIYNLILFSYNEIYFKSVRPFKVRPFNFNLNSFSNFLQSLIKVWI